MKTKWHQIVPTAIEFIKLQLAGNIIFWGTYLGYFVSDYFFGHPDIFALAIASLIAHGLFFIVSREWVFDSKTGKRRDRQDVYRFVIFMGIGYFLNLFIIESLRVQLGISPYIGQFISGMFFAVWNYVGLKWWVFAGSNYYNTPLSYKQKQRKEALSND